jgi:hypothetical protein
MATPSSNLKDSMNKRNMAKDPLPPKQGSSNAWLIAIVILVIALCLVATQFTHTLSGLVGGGSITTREGAQEWKNDLEKLGLENVTVVSQGDTTTIGFTLPQNPEALLKDKASLAGLVLRVNSLPDKQKVNLQPKGYGNYQTTGKQAKELLQKTIESGGSLDEATLQKYVQQIPNPL